MEKSRNSYTEDWLKNLAVENSNQCITNEHNLAACLYQECYTTFKILCDGDFFDSSSKPTARNVLARLYLWGEGLQVDKIEQSLVQLEDVRRELIQLLVSIGDSIVCAEVSCEHKSFAIGRGLPFLLLT